MNETFKYKLLIVIRYLGDALYYPFISLYLRSTGLVEDKIGFLLSLTPLIGILLNPIYNKLAKNLKTIRIILIIVSIFEASFIGLIGLSNNYYYILVLIILIAIFGTSHYGLMDSLMAVYSQKSNVNFSNIRVYGSIAYIIGTTLGGSITKNISYFVCFLIGSFMMLFGALIYIWLKPIEEDNTSKSNHSYKELFKNKTFISFMIMHCLIMSLHNVTGNFYSLFLQTKGLNSDAYGKIYSFQVIFEVLTLFILPHIKNNKNVKVSHLIIIVLMSIRMFVNSLDLPSVFYIIVAPLSGISYALLLNTTYTYLVKLLGDDKASNGNMLLTLLVSILNVVFNNIDGKIINLYGYSFFYKYIVISYIVIGIFGVYRITKKE